MLNSSSLSSNNNNSNNNNNNNNHNHNHNENQTASNFHSPLGIYYSNAPSQGWATRRLPELHQEESPRSCRKRRVPSLELKANDPKNEWLEDELSFCEGLFSEAMLL